MATRSATRLDRIEMALRPTTVTRIPRRHVVFDTESTNDWTNGVETQTWQLGCYTVLDYDRKDPLPSGNVHTVTDPFDMYKRITRLCRRGCRTVTWCHNLGYDIRVSNGFVHLPRLGWRLEGAVLERQAAWISWRRDNATLLMCDLASWLPAPLWKLARDFDMEKIALDTNNIEARCVRDVVITAKCVDELLRYLWANDLGSFRPTGSGMSYSAFARKHMQHKIVSHADPDVLQIERTAMWTGRCEVWKWGTDRGKPAWEYDLENAYANIGKECDMPTRYLAQVECKDVSTPERFADHYRFMCDCTVRTRMPVVPCNRANTVVWPIGVFRTVLWDNEYRLAVEQCEHVIPHTVYLYRRAPALQSWSTWILETLRNTSDGGAPIIARMLKLWSRSLIGRLALRYADWEYVGEAPSDGAGISRTIDYDTGSQGFDLHIGRDYFERGEMREGYSSVPMVTGYVMAEARIRLWRIMQLAGLGNVRYVDTDGLIVTFAGKKKLDAAIRNGDAYTLRLKQNIFAANIRAPRNLDLTTTRRIAGVPRKARYLSNGVYDGEVWRGVQDSLLRGEVDNVKVTPRRFEVKAIDTRRIHLPHYDTMPFTEVI